MRLARPYLLIVLALACHVSAVPGWPLSLEEEVRLGRQVMAELRPLGLTQDPALDAIGRRLAATMERQNLPWRFWVIEQMRDHNAFAAPGGPVFITRSYYEKLSQDEVAFVLGHEMAHIDRRHYEKQMRRIRSADLGSLLLRVITRAEGGWGAAVDLGATAYVTHYSRVLEREADFAGYRSAQQAGFDAAAAVTALSKLGQQADLHPWIANIYATHPILSSREDRLAALGGTEPQDVQRPPPDPRHTRDVTRGLRPLEPPVPVAVRILGRDGARWENRWRKSFTRLLHLRLVPLGFRIAGDDLMYKPDIGDPVEAARSRQADYLLLVTVRTMEAAATGPEEIGGTPTRAKLDLTARFIAVADGRPVGDDIGLSEELQGVDVLPPDPDVLYPDTAVGRLAERAAGEIALACARAAGAHPAASPDS